MRTVQQLEDETHSGSLAHVDQYAHPGVSVQ